MDSVVVTYAPADEPRALIDETLGPLAKLRYLDDVPQAERAEVLAGATVIIAFHPAKELAPEEFAHLAHAKLVQFLTAGVDFIPFDLLPEGVTAACNRGGYAPQMGEHALAMAFAAAKRLLPEHRELARDNFNQFIPNRMLGGGVCGILGFGGAGKATARLMRALDMRIMAISRTGRTDEPVDFIGGPEALDQVLEAADVLVVVAPLTIHTKGMIGAAELDRMKDTAIIVNLARGEIIDEEALYNHLKAHPRFTACIDAWWVEPVRHGRFAMGFPFLELPNVIGSPHNSASILGGSKYAMRQILDNVRRVLRGEPPQMLIGPDDRPPEPE